MQNQEIVELLKSVNAGADVPSLLAKAGIATKSLPPRRRRQLLNRICWAANSFASTIERAGAAINSVAVADDKSSWAMSDEDRPCADECALT